MIFCAVAFPWWQGSIYSSLPEVLILGRLEGKPRPDFLDTDAHQVSLTLRGEIQNPEFLRFLARVAREQGTQFSLEAVAK